MWQPTPELQKYVDYVVGSINPAVLKARLLQLAINENGTTALKAIEMLMSMGDGIGGGSNDVSWEDARRIAQVEKALLGDGQLDDILGDIAKSLGESETDAHYGLIPAFLTRIRKDESPAIQDVQAQPSPDGRTDIS